MKPSCHWKRDGDGRYYVPCLDGRVDKPRQVDADESRIAHCFGWCPYCGGMLQIAGAVGAASERDTAQGLRDAELERRKDDQPHRAEGGR